MNREEIHIYYDGVKNGLWRHAWWRDGVEYVGNSGVTLKEALAKVEQERKQELERAVQ
jgi:hypothetical protein